MDWARLIGSFIGATVIAALAGWQIYSRLVRPVIKRFEPVVAEITGPGNEPGIRRLVEDVGVIARAGMVAANNAATSCNALRDDFQIVAHEQGALREDVKVIKADVSALKESRDKQGERIGEVEKGLAEVRARISEVKDVQDRRGCPALAHGSVAEGSQVRAGAGADTEEILDPQPPRARTV